MIIYDAKNAVVGRLAAKVAKDLLNGEEVEVINVSQMVLSGKPEYHKNQLQIHRAMVDKKDPQKVEKFPRIPYMLFKKSVSGMLPKKSQRGRDALKKLKAHDGVPIGVDVSKAQVYELAIKTDLTKSITLEDLCKAFGYKN
jgi:ribosomal protein uL13